MAITTPQSRFKHAASTNGGDAAPVRADWRDPRYQAFSLLRLAFTVAPIAFGLDKFFNVLVDWPTYLAPWINDIAPGSGQDFMYVVGAVEILAGIIVALKPRYGAYLVAGWLASSSTCSPTPASTTSPCATSGSCSPRSPSPASRPSTTPRCGSAATERPLPARLPARRHWSPLT